MSVHRVSASWIQNNPWVVALKKAPSIEVIVKLLIGRALNPDDIGPFCQSSKYEHPFELIVDLVDAEQLDHKQIDMAVSEILIGINSGQISENNELLESLFYLISQLSLSNSSEALLTWIQSRREAYLASQKEEALFIFASALSALAYSQNIDLKLEQFWKEFWNGSDHKWWYSSFLGLTLQNPIKAVDCVELLMGRDIDGTSDLLSKLWFQKSGRPLLERKIKARLITELATNEQKWAARALNELAKDMSPELQGTLLKNLKEINFIINASGTEIKSDDKTTPNTSVVTSSNGVMTNNKALPPWPGYCA